MLMALNEKNKLIQAHKKLKRKKDYYCPACNEKVYLKIGEIIQPHFAHFKKNQCEVFSEGETEEHLKGKKLLAEAFKEINKQKKLDLRIEIEAYLPKLKQRPDLLVCTEDEKYAIEFQCSSISIEDVLRRTKGYQKYGYQVIWVLGSKFTYKKKLTTFQKACMYQNIKEGNMGLFHLNVDNCQLIIRDSFLLSQDNMLTFQQKNIDLKEIKIQKKRISKIVQPILTRTSYERKHKQLLKDQRFKRESSRIFFQLLYHNRENIQELPIELYVTMPSEWMIQTYSFEWKYRFILWLERIPKSRIITRKYLYRWINSEEEKDHLRYHSFVQLTDEQKISTYKEYLQFLAKSDFIKKIGKQEWKVTGRLKRYKSFEERYIFFKTNSL